MTEDRTIMGMPVRISANGTDADKAAIEEAFSFFEYVDLSFSPYKSGNELSRLNNGDEKISADLAEILDLCEKTRKETGGYFDIQNKDGKIDPSGLVKGWAILKAAKIIEKRGIEDYFVDAGGDIELCGLNSEGKFWSVGIRNPFNKEQIVKRLRLGRGGIATSGNYERGRHIYDPLNNHGFVEAIASITVIGPNVLEADRFATAAFAMGEDGIRFIDEREGLEGYMIDLNGRATMTRNFNKFVADD